MANLPRAFYARPACTVARELLGKRLVHVIDGQRISGIIVETEAYCDSAEPDLACHASRNQGRPTKRTTIMFGEAGHVYMYFNYGMHWLFNVVTGEVDQANAVLVRALQPDEGAGFMQQQRGKQKRPNWTNGPGKLAQALGLDGHYYGHDLCQNKSALWIEAADVEGISAETILSGPRIGLGKTPEPWLSIPWRYWLADNAFVSR